ncbi:hypothetical protein [Alteromonas gracilis]|uniref:hypothetical protein n=1 Tax=Alteromonas gracilis TaxID=1479524 RepID=UPI003735F2BB
MTTPIATFFEAWKIQGAEARFNKISAAVTKNVKYNDPRTQQTLNGILELSDYVGMFSSNAPGWVAEVKKHDEMGDMTRVTVSFSGPGPDGANQEQFGQYFIEREGDLLSRLYGFVGTGEL